MLRCRCSHSRVLLICAVQAGLFDGIFRGGGYLEIFGVEEAGFRWGLIDRDLMLNEALLEGNDVRSMVVQQQVLDHVFSPLFLANRVSADRLLPIVIENIRSRVLGLFHYLSRPARVLFSCLRRSTGKYNNRVDVAMHEFLVRLCLQCSPPRYTTLHYLVQYQIIEASRVIARMLLQGEQHRAPNALPKRIHLWCAVEQCYAGASQLALDMLLKVDAHEELIMVLLQRQQVIPALKYVRERSIVVPAASFLKVAKDTGDNGARNLHYPHPCRFAPRFLIFVAAIFFAVFKYFESISESKTVASQSLHDVRSMRAVPRAPRLTRSCRSHAPSMSSTSAKRFVDKWQGCSADHSASPPATYTLADVMPWLLARSSWVKS
jgi:hypothetical protein